MTKYWKLLNDVTGEGPQTSIKRVSRGREHCNDEIPKGSFWLLLHRQALQESKEYLFFDSERAYEEIIWCRTFEDGWLRRLCHRWIDSERELDFVVVYPESG